MPATLEAQWLQDEQGNDSELKDLPDKDNTSLKLQKLPTDAKTLIYYDISIGYFRPYIPALLQQKVFAIIHNPSHPSGKVTCQQLRQKYVWPNIRKDICLGVAPASPANVPRSNDTTKTLRMKSTFRFNA
jgi:hypothetical protein